MGQLLMAILQALLPFLALALDKGGINHPTQLVFIELRQAIVQTVDFTGQLVPALSQLLTFHGVHILEALHHPLILLDLLHR